MSTDTGMIPDTGRRQDGLFAVVCGVDDYQGVYSSLGSAVSDAQRLADVLARCWGESANIDLLTWPASPAPRAGFATVGTASAPTILTSIQRMARLTGEGDSLLVYCKCHCVGRANGACLVTAGTDSGVDFVSLEDLLTAADRAPARRRLLILDWPYMPEPDGTGVLERLRDMAEGWTVWLGCGVGEAALDLGPGARVGDTPAGLFADSLIREIERNATTTVYGAELPRIMADTVRRMAVHQSQAVSDWVPTDPQRRPRKDSASNPVLAAGPFASDGRFGYLLAPPVSKRDSAEAETRPTPFIDGLRRYSFGPWPLAIPYSGAMRWILSLNYALVMFSSAQTFRAQPLAPASLVVAAAVGLFSLVLWPVLMASLVAADAARLERGALFPPAGLLLWGAFVLAVTVTGSGGLTSGLGLLVPVIDTLAVAGVLAVYAYSLTTLVVLAQYEDRGSLRFLVQLVNRLELGWDVLDDDGGETGHTRAPARLPMAVTDQNSVFRQKSVRPLWCFLFWLTILVCGAAEQFALEALAPAHGWGWLLFRNGWLWIYGLLYCTWYLYAYYASRNIIRRR